MPTVLVSMVAAVAYIASQGTPDALGVALALFLGTVFLGIVVYGRG
jgi:hypothetical protein